MAKTKKDSKNVKTVKKTGAGSGEVNISREERIGFHKGALDCLIKEKAELVRLVTIVDQLIQLHLKSLKELGVDLEQKSRPKTSKKPPIEEVLSNL